jgi:hypothetical protein
MPNEAEGLPHLKVAFMALDVSLIGFMALHIFAMILLVLWDGILPTPQHSSH